jgi:hypothetical protein
VPVSALYSRGDLFGSTALARLATAAPQRLFPPVNLCAASTGRAAA